MMQAFNRISSPHPEVDVGSCLPPNESIIGVLRDIYKLHSEISERTSLLCSSLTGPMPTTNAPVTDGTYLLGTLKGLRDEMRETQRQVCHLHEELVG
ncbi:hypothetical protein AA102526_2694 [Asaia lannensis NBRC 102526]|nr:hypothetical protein AA102526_2694 [Asaia lannensis NBRC 102526]